MTDRQRIFELLETADNFVKYAPSGREERAAQRARKRYQRALDLARSSGDDEMAAQASLRLDDLERRASLPPGARDDSARDGGDGVVTAELPEHAQARVPPGQRVTRGWPVLHEGPIPRFDRTTWRLTVTGLVETPVELTYDELQALENVEMRADFHCVTGWSKLDNFWLGVRAADVLRSSNPHPDATHVTVGADYGYTANLPLEALLDSEALLAWGHNGGDLAPKHGWPLRLVVPKLYGWKSVKWVRSFELMAVDRRGFWEVRGYHNRADPWLEERYAYQET
ncbi:MAG TPA: sulfite oxidase-like oxidoreductase [Actinomycetota bacterium]|jgi:DMSO/TMAO reductase YedYZ molybdopterin-dependent catalytic subunit